MLDFISDISRGQIQEQKKIATQTMTHYCSRVITNLTADIVIAEAVESEVSDENIELFLRRCNRMLE